MKCYPIPMMSLSEQQEITAIKRSLFTSHVVGLARRAQRGVSMLMFAATGTMMVGFIGVALYAGLNAFIQTELQQMANGMAGAAARSMYDNFDASGQPIISGGQATAAADAVRVRFLSANPALAGLGGVIVVNQAIDTGNETARITLQKNIPTPLLGPIGINTLNIQASSTARYGQMNIPSGLLSINTATGPYTRLVNIDPPLLNGPGPDIYINTGISGGGYHGVMVEVCSGGQCYNVGHGARIANNNGTVVLRNGYRVLYGQFFIDIDAVGVDAKKGVAIKIMDDGVHDFYSPTGSRGLELVPAPTIPSSLRVMRFASLCSVNGGACNLPTGFISGSTAYN